ncbi:MAG TPA: lysozyme family protein [Candidatus Blautia faecavium]|uniref:Lysozyme family protein n=1 Tax=Candidatus Blautia faecavium TaxID=2838487 RepID=A0A9D2LPT9_9FIRM|nr:lysozyme family protein [Candidatus Blautia faecavium]
MKKRKVTLAALSVAVAVSMASAPATVHAGIFTSIFQSLTDLVDRLLNDVPDEELSLLNEAAAQKDEFGNQVWWDDFNKDFAYKIYRITNWNNLPSMNVGLRNGLTTVKAILSEDLEAYVPDLEQAAQEYGFAAYQELFKAIAQYRHQPGNPDIFRIADTGLNPNPGKNVGKEDSIRIAAELFARCIQAARYPDPTDTETLKAVLQAFEFEDAGFVQFCQARYTLEKAEQYASARCGGREREKQVEKDAYGKYDYKDQKFPDKVLKYYSVVAFDSGNIPEAEQSLIMEAMSGWPSGLDERRKKVIETGLSLYGKISYSMDMRLQPSPQAPQYLDCSSFVGWAFYFGGCQDVSYSWATGGFLSSPAFTPISSGELTPGDIGLKNTIASGGDNHIGIYMGKSASGQNVWLHCTGGNLDRIVANTYGGFTLFYRYHGFQ